MTQEEKPFFIIPREMTTLESAAVDNYVKKAFAELSVKDGKPRKFDDPEWIQAEIRRSITGINTLEYTAGPGGAGDYKIMDVRNEARVKEVTDAFVKELVEKAAHDTAKESSPQALPHIAAPEKSIKQR